MDVIERKKNLRRLNHRLFSELTKEQIGAESSRICREICANEHVKNAHVVMAFSPLPIEPMIMPAVESLLCSGKVVLMPHVEGNDITLRQYNGSDSMEEGEYHILEPKDLPSVGKKDIDVVLVPGVAFSHDGYRLGRGKGYYDRFLADIPNAWTIGVPFAYQITDDVPVEEHDVRLNEVIGSK